MRIGHTYLVHLDRRTDRKDGYFAVDAKGNFIMKDCAPTKDNPEGKEKVWVQGYIDKLKYAIPDYEVISAIDGKTLDVVLPEETPEKRWNKGSYALCLTTINIIKDAIAKGYENVLILEDDIAVNPLFDISIDDYLNDMKLKFDFLFLGYSTFGNATKPVTARWDKITQMCSCHAYVINKHMYQPYLDMLQRLDNPIDVYVNAIVGARDNSFCAVKYGGKKLFWQENGISDIESVEGTHYDTSFTQ